jgi:hypothetical protein
MRFRQTAACLPHLRSSLAKQGVALLHMHPYLRIRRKKARQQVTLHSLLTCSLLPAGHGGNGPQGGTAASAAEQGARGPGHTSQPRLRRPLAAGVALPCFTV